MNMLFAPEPTAITLREYQADAVQRLREGIRGGCRRQVLVAPTGSGKTEMAMNIVQESQRKGASAWFIVDRIALIDQTSDRFAQYGIDHGVIQADHWLTDRSKPVQIASAQTIARRKFDVLPDLIVIDEAHCRYKSTAEIVARAERAKVIGLTATPFTAGMAEDWDGLVNTTTVNKLLAEGYLAPLKIKACVAPDMTGAKKKFTGEYEEEEAGTRGLTIIGDVVQTWIEQTRKHFGGPAKTIVFSPSVAHGAELCRQFSEAGFNFQQLSYLDNGDDERRAKIAEFRKPDSVIHGLVSCAVLTKGFDVPDCLVGISCRPYRKSFSSHIQEMGRVMRTAPGKEYGLWLCLARGSRVLTDKGLIPIEKITRSHKVWDGERFVNHGGAVCNGIQPVITYHGLTATPGHLVHTAAGWRTFGDCAEKQIPITQTGLGGAPIRVSEDHLSGRAVARPAEAPLGARGLRVRDLWVSLGRLVEQFAERSDWWLQRVRPATSGLPAMALPAGASDARSVQESDGSWFRQIWRTRRRVPLLGCEGWDAVDHGELGHPGELQGSGLGSHRSDRSLRTRQSSVALSSAEPAQQARQSVGGPDAQVPHRPSRRALRRLDARALLSRWLHRGRDREALASAVPQAEREVWDILDAGPHNRFTCEGLLVHNCHSSNAIAFADDTAWLFEYGVDSLSDAQKRDSEVREPKEKTRKERFCGCCGMAMDAGAMICASCGWEKPQRGEIEIVQGELIDLDLKVGERFAPRKGLRAECLKDPKAVFNAALSYATYHTRKGPEAARKWAMGIWFGIYDGAKPPRGFFDVSVNHGKVIPEQWSLVEREVNKFRRTNKRSAA